MRLEVEAAARGVRVTVFRALGLGVSFSVGRSVGWLVGRGLGLKRVRITSYTDWVPEIRVRVSVRLVAMTGRSVLGLRCICV